MSRSPTESEIAIVAYRLWLERGCPIGSAQQDWLRAEALLKNALAVKCEDPLRRPSVCREARAESEPWDQFQGNGHWEVWEHEWAGAIWVPDVPRPSVAALNRAYACAKAA